MPIIVFPNEETQQSVTRSVVLAAVDAIREKTGIPDDIRIVYPGETETAPQPNSTMTGYTGPVFGAKETLLIEITEEHEEDALVATPVLQPESLAWFKDWALSTAVRPVYVESKITITVKYKARDKTTAERWRNQIRTKWAQSVAGYVFDASYMQLFPEEFLVILKEIHRLRESTAPYNEDWYTYFKGHTTPRLTTVTNQSGSHARYAFPETQSGIQGIFDFEGMPEEGSRESESSAWTVSFSFHFNYDKPVSAVMNYPVMIHNQVLDQYYRPAPEDTHKFPDRKVLYHGKYSYLNYQLESGSQLQRFASKYGDILVPEYSEFVPEFVYPRTNSLVTFMMQLDLNDHRDVFNLPDAIVAMLDHEIKPAVLAFLRAEAKWLTKQAQTIYNVALYEGMELMQSTCLTVDANLNIKTTFDMNPRNIYHLRFGILWDWSMIPADRWEEIRKHGEAVLESLKAIDPWLWDKIVNGNGNGSWSGNGSWNGNGNGSNNGDTGGAGTAVPGGIGEKPKHDLIPRPVVTEIKEELNRHDARREDSLKRGFFTVQTLIIEANNAISS
jgi:hypothetical protein